MGKSKRIIFPKGPIIYIPKFGDVLKFGTLWEIWRYKNDDDFFASREAGDPDAYAYDKSEIPGNLLLNEGAQAIWRALTGLAAITQFSNANARIGVGDSTTAEADTQTGLLGSSVTYRGMDTGFPQITGTGNDTVEFQSVFGSADGNHAWNEFTVDNGATAGVNLNRKVSAQGTKSSGQTWTVKVSIQAV